MTEGELSTVERYARRCIAEHLARGVNWNTIHDVISGHGLERYEIQAVTDRVQALAQELASEFEYEPRMIFSKKKERP